MSHQNSSIDDIYIPTPPASPKKMASGKHLKRKKKKKKNKHHKLKGVGLTVLLLAMLIMVFHTFTSPRNPLDDFTLTSSAYKRILKQPLEEITEALSPSVRDTPIILSLIEEAATYPKAKILLANHEAYPDMLLELAANRPETLDFVINYTNYETSSLNTEGTRSISINDDFSPGSIPLFIQWDKRWGYDAYGNEFIATSGCGPTALSMVAVGLTGNTDMHPKAVSDFSYDLGYFHAGQGTSWSLMSEGATKLGLNSEELPLDASRIYRALEEGKPIIVSMKPGHFTGSGHFIVLTGTTSDGKIKVNDPGSIENSEITWDLDIIMNESKNLWAFSAA